MPTDDELQLIAPGTRPRLWMFGLGVLLPVGITAAALAWAAAGEGPKRLIADSMPITMAVSLGAVALITLVVWKVLDRAMCRHTLSLADGRLKIATSFYSIDMGIAELKLDQARVIDLHERTEYKPRWKTNGYSVPGFHSGHYRLRNREKAFVAIVGERRALWLPSVRGQGLLLQSRQPDALLQRLRELADARAHR